MPIAAGIPNFRFEPPPVASEIDQSCTVVLSCRSGNTKAGAKDVLLSPLFEFRSSHRRAANQIDGEPVNRIEQPGSVDIGLSVKYRTPEVRLAIRHPSGKACAPGKKIKRMKERDYGYVCFRGSICNRERAL